MTCALLPCLAVFLQLGVRLQLNDISLKMRLDEKEKELFSSSCSKYVALSFLKCFAGEQKKVSRKKECQQILPEQKSFSLTKIF